MLQKYNPKNENIYIHIGGHLLQRKEAKISVFDSVVQGGDAVWEGLRLYKDGIFCLDKHLDRLFASAKALKFENIPDRLTIKKAIAETLEKNKMDEACHIRLTLTRGEKITSGMDPRLNQKSCCLIVLAEWKAPVYDNKSGIKVITSSVRRNSPQFLDSRIHHNNLLNNILAKIQANVAGADEALMLDDRGFVSELNGTNLFLVKKNSLYTPFTNACLPGITRGLVIELTNTLNIPFQEKNLSLTDFYCADEVFATGSMGELTPVIEIDGRKLETRADEGILAKIYKSFFDLIPAYCEKL